MLTFSELRHAAALIGACEASGKTINATSKSTFNFNNENTTIDKSSAVKNSTTAWVFGSTDQVKIA